MKHVSFLPLCDESKCVINHTEKMQCSKSCCDLSHHLDICVQLLSKAEALTFHTSAKKNLLPGKLLKKLPLVLPWHCACRKIQPNMINFSLVLAFRGRVKFYPLLHPNGPFFWLLTCCQYQQQLIRRWEGAASKVSGPLLNRNKEAISTDPQPIPTDSAKKERGATEETADLNVSVLQTVVFYSFISHPMKPFSSLDS